MSEKRFERWNDHSCKVKDNQEDTLLDWEDVVKKLNGQQATITELNDELEESSSFIIEQRKENKTLKEENEKLIQKKCLPCELVNLQTREIDKLKKENEQLKEEYKIAVDEMVTDYKKLEKENEQLRKELNDCEKFRYTVFKLMGELDGE